MKRKAPRTTLPERSSHQESGLVYIYGARAVEEVLRHQPTRVKKVLLVGSGEDRSFARWDAMLKNLTSRVDVCQVSRDFLDERFPDAVHQGIALELQPLPTRNERTLREDAHRLTSGVFLALDEVQDPHNTGAVLRVAEATAARGIIVPERRSASLGETVRKVSVGASELVPTYEITNLARVLTVLKEADWWIVGLNRGEESKSLFTDKFPEKTVLVLGAEGKGIRPVIAAACDYTVSIPMYGVIDSLNVSQAATVALYSYRQQYPRKEV